MTTQRMVKDAGMLKAQLWLERNSFVIYLWSFNVNTVRL